MAQDDSKLTLEQLYNDLLSFRELVVLRLDAIEKAHEMQSASTPSVLYTEMFNAIQKQFDERDVRHKASEAAALTAVTIALDAQKEAAAAQKAANVTALVQSENIITKQIDTTGLMLTSNIKVIDDKITNIGNRLEHLEKIGDNGSGRSDGYGKIGILATAIIISLIIGGLILVQIMR